MKGQIWQSYRRPPKLYWSDIILTILPALAWAAAVQSRPAIMNLRCAQHPESCTAESVPWPDRLSLGQGNMKADSASFVTQDLSGALAVAVPTLWAGGLALAGRITPVGALISAGTDLLIVSQTVAWNGVATESARLLVQRPRPFVYADPAHLGSEPAHYTSFFSGHTSFSAAAGAGMLLALLGRGAPGLLVSLAAIAASLLTFMTGMFRVLGGRHFVTDVLAGALAGALIACFVAYFHRPSAGKT